MIRRFRALAAVLTATLLGGCLTVPPAYGPEAADCSAQTADPATAQGPVYFVSTGLPDCLAGQPLALSVGRGTFRPYGTPPPQPVRYGLATPGTPELPALSLAPAAAWHDRLRRDLAGPPRRILLYVHGYNTNPVQALSEVDQIAMAARFDGPAIAFLWPSQRRLAKYTWDEENARWTQAYFDAVLADLAKLAPELVLVSHSMGNRIAIDGLGRLQATAPDLAARVRIVVLASPDVDRELFDRDLAPDIVRDGRRIALFASGHDVPLRSSWAVHGNPRAGDVGCAFRLRRNKPVDTERCYPAPRGAPGALTVIDGTDLPGKPLGHSNHIDTPEGRTALRQLLASPSALPAGTKGVLRLTPDATPDCTSGPSRLKLAYTVARCPTAEKRKKGK
ncbi:MAG: alpha/beta hydrolase [Sphingomonas sp.]